VNAALCSLKVFFAPTRQAFMVPLAVAALTASLLAPQPAPVCSGSSDIVRQRGLASARVLTSCCDGSSRPLPDRAIENIVAFTRLLGYVRFFHPTDAAARQNWDDFAMSAIPLVEGAPHSDSLATVLRRIFAEVAPTVVIYPVAAPPPPSRAAWPTSPELAIVFWRHLGYGPTEPSRIYRSERLRVSAPDGRPPQRLPFSIGRQRAPTFYTVPDPREPLTVALGAGVAARIPLALYTVEPLPDSLARPYPDPTRDTASPNDRSTRLAAVALLWSTLQHFYPYFGVVPADWAAALPTALQAAALDESPEEFERTLERLIAKLQDGHASVNAEGPRGQWKFANAPVRLSWVENRIVVTAVGGTARTAGVRIGDELIAIDGQPAQRVLEDEMSRTSGATPGFVRATALLRLLRGPPGSRVELQLRDPITPRASTRSLVLARVRGPLPLEPRPAPIAELRPGVFYVDLSRITDASFDAALERLRRAEGVVFDLRAYPRDVNTPHILAMLSDSSMRSGLFELPIITRPDGQEVVYYDVGWPVAPALTRLPNRVAFLAGPLAVSYGETTLGIIEAFRLGAIVGDTTAGTNGNVNFIRLPGGYVARFTGMRVRKHDGSRLHGVGILPTERVVQSLRAVRAGRDDVLERALDIVAGPRRTGRLARPMPNYTYGRTVGVQ
jgi:C-terminal processing protease CtpA/Prc